MDENKNSLVQKAKTLKFDSKKNIILEFSEVELHKHLKELYEGIDSSYCVEITHGRNELGKDIVLVKKDNIASIVVAVVVKKGDVKAKTLGEVDQINARIDSIFSATDQKKLSEIESQIRQAFLHPAEIKSSFSKLPVNKVIVIIAGEVSVEARRRLQQEIDKQIEVNDILWLVENFTDHYPQIFFDAEVINYIHNQIHALESNHWLSKKKINLSDFYVDPMVNKIDVPIDINEKTIAKILRTRKLPFTELKRVATNNAKIIIIGEPGVGKSGALSKISIDMLKEVSNEILNQRKKEQTLEIPILMKARDLKNIQSHQDILKLIPEEIRHRSAVNVLLIDALDEVSKNERNDILEKINSLSKEINCAVVVTSRNVEIAENSILNFEKYELLPFEFNQAFKLFEKLFKDNKLLSSLKSALEEIGNQIPLVPLSLNLLMEIVEDSKEVPASIAELYDRYLDMIFGRWDKEKGLEVLFDYIVKKTYLSTLAYEQFYSKNLLMITGEQFQKFNDTYRIKYSWEANYLDNFIQEIGRIGILEIGDHVFFRHRSFLDYFNATYIFDHRDEFEEINKKIVKIYFDRVWSDTAFFYIGLKRQINENLLNLIFEQEDDGTIDNLITKAVSGRLLQAGWHSESELKTKGINQAISYTPKLRSKLVELNGKLRVPNIFADFFIMMLSEYSFGSSFLVKETNALIDKKIENLDSVNVNEVVALLWAINRLSNEEERRSKIGKLLEGLTKIQIDKETEIRLLVLMSVIERGDKNLVKTINKRIKKLQNKSFNLFDKFLPKRRHRFRK